MKRLLVMAAVLALGAVMAAQEPAKKAPLSPAATAWWRAGEQEIVRIDYSSPRVRGREGKLFTKDGPIGHDPTYPVWRAGANAATKLHVASDLVIGELAVPKGDYTLFVDISNPAAWVLIISKQTGQWGTVYDAKQDLGRVKLTMDKPEALIENLSYGFVQDRENRAQLTLGWEWVEASVEVKRP